MGPFSGPLSVFLFLSAAVVSMFSFLAVASWANARLKERESFYKSELLKKVSENSGPGATAALELLREENRVLASRRQASLREGGLVTASVGLGLLIFLRALVPQQGAISLCSLIVLLPGLALFGSSYMRRRVE